MRNAWENEDECKQAENDPGLQFSKEMEIEVKYRKLAEKIGVPGFYRAETVGTHPAFIDGLAKLVQDHANQEEICAEGGRRLCPPEFRRCAMSA